MWNTTNPNQELSSNSISLERMQAEGKDTHLFPALLFERRVPPPQQIHRQPAQHQRCGGQFPTLPRLAQEHRRRGQAEPGTSRAIGATVAAGWRASSQGKRDTHLFSDLLGTKPYLEIL